FRMDEVKTIERVTLVLDAAVHVGTACLASVALDHCGGIDDLQLVAILEHRHVLTGHHRDDRECCASRLPALGAAAGMVVGDVALDADLDRLVLAFADDGPAGENAGAFLYATVDGWMEIHEPILLAFGVVPGCLRMILRKTDGSCVSKRRLNGSTCLHASGRSPC